FGTTAPDGSVTVPRISAEVTCAGAETAVKSRSRRPAQPLKCSGNRGIESRSRQDAIRSKRDIKPLPCLQLTGIEPPGNPKLTPWTIANVCASCQDHIATLLACQEPFMRSARHPLASLETQLESDSLSIVFALH